MNNSIELIEAIVAHIMLFPFLQIVGHVESSCASITAQDITTLHSLKLDFMRIVCSHEHYVALNLPINLPATTPPSGPPSPTASVASSNSQSSLSAMSLADRNVSTELSGEFRMQHFLTGIVLSDLSTMLQ
jgi:dedicator of cytokinesis protein 6/7/8